MNLVYARNKDGSLAAFEVPSDLDLTEVIDAVKSELGVDRALVLVHDAAKNTEKGSSMNDFIKPPAFVRDQTEDEVQPVHVQRQGPYIAVIQWDGTGEQQHWVLVPVVDLTDFIDSLESAAA